MTPKKVLLVDNDPDILKIGMLSLSGVAKWRVTTASSGKEAILIAAQEEPDLIMLDTSMPEMDGITTMQQLRQAPALKNVPIVFTSTRVEEGEEEFYKSKGAVGLIAKPFNPETLANELKAKLTSN